MFATSVFILLGRTKLDILFIRWVPFINPNVSKWLAPFINPNVNKWWVPFINPNMSKWWYHS
jgi:hypothetical protein